MRPQKLFYLLVVLIMGSSSYGEVSSTYEKFELQRMMIDLNLGTVCQNTKAICNSKQYAMGSATN